VRDPIHIDDTDNTIQGYSNNFAYKLFENRVLNNKITHMINDNRFFEEDNQTLATIGQMSRNSSLSSMPSLSRNSSISSLASFNSNQQTIGGNIQYVYVKPAPKNVTFSKRNPRKKINKKTLRKLQNIINNAK
jgi:hypothetical protein